jgi:hypothetical protein
MVVVVVGGLAISRAIALASCRTGLMASRL